MKIWAVNGTVALLGSALTLALPHAAHAAHAKAATNKALAPAHEVAHSPIHSVSSDHLAVTSGRSSLLHNAFAAHSLSKHSFLKNGKQRMYSGGYSGISCVPFARSASGIELKGNAVNWWDAASGVYQRGRAPERGSVLNFRATGRMRLGHVAVVTAVVNSREVEVDHANWAGGGVERGIPVIDVSPDNDWSEVRVSLKHSGDFGSVYPTYGFIYDRPDHGTILANTSANRSAGFDEVAEAPASASASQFIDAPNHSLR
jgi:surface antigen